MTEMRTRVGAPATSKSLSGSHLPPRLRRCPRWEEVANAGQRNAGQRIHPAPPTQQTSDDADGGVERYGRGLDLLLCVLRVSSEEVVRLVSQRAMVLGIARRFPTGDSRRRMLPCAVSNVHGGDDRGERLYVTLAPERDEQSWPRKSDRPRESKPFGRLRDTAPATIAVPTVWCLGRSTSEKLSPATRGSIPSKRTPACRIYPVMRLLRHAGSPVRQRVAVGGTISPSILPNDHPALRSAPPLATRLTTTTPHPSLDSHRRHGNTSARRPRPPPRRILIQESSLRSHTLPRCNETKQTKPKASAPSLGSSLAFRPLGFCYDTSPLSPAGRPEASAHLCQLTMSCSRSRAFDGTRTSCHTRVQILYSHPRLVDPCTAGSCVFVVSASARRHATSTR
ncbi:unnamed protein product [Diplocarpon coronariae]